MEFGASKYFRHALGAIGALLFPPVCVFCGTGRVTSDSSVCESCSRDIEFVEDPICNLCGLPVPGLQSGSQRRCGKCLQHKPLYDKARFSVYYSRVIRRGILKFKFQNSLFLGETLSSYLIKTFQEHFLNENLDAIIPIPVHNRRLVRRGYNQCAILARKLGNKVNLEVLTNTLNKTVNTIPQARLKRKQRIENVKGSFSVRNPEEIRGKRLLLLDDVFTTGSTISEASRTLIKHEAKSVQALVLSVRHGAIEKDSGEHLDIFTEIFFVGGKRNQEEEKWASRHRRSSRRA